MTLNRFQVHGALASLSILLTQGTLLRRAVGQAGPSARPRQSFHNAPDNRWLRRIAGRGDEIAPYAS